MKKIIICLFFIFICTGCNYTELNQISIITLLTIDKKNNTYFIQSLTTDENIEELKSYEGKGKTISSALNDLDLKLNKKMYLSHLQTIIISEKLAKEGINPILNYFLKNENVRDNFYLIIAENTDGKHILNKIKKEKLSLNNIYNLVSREKMNSPIINNTVNNFLKNMLDDGIDPSLNYINKNLEIKNIALFKNDKLIGKNTHTNEINLLTGMNKSILISIKCKNNINVIINNIQIREKKKKKKLIITLYGTSEIIDGTCFLNNASLNKKINNKLTSSLKKTIDELKIKNADILGLGKKYNNEKNYFKNLNIKINTKIRLNNRNEEYYE